jgi:poly(hydroxyalkanoate) granule-associated protein
MAKKLSEVADDHDQQLAQAVRTSAQQIWQAGLGAFVKSQQEQQAAGGEGGGGGGDHTFERLVAEGSVLQQRVRASSAEDEEEAADDGADDIARQAASGSWDKLEQVFEDRVVRALGAIGVPSKRDLAALADQVARLTAQVEALQRALEVQAPPPRTPD